MTVRQTSLMAYRSVDKETLKGRVLECIIYNGEQTNTEISRKTGIPINIVTPRTNELIKDGILELGAKRECSITGYMCNTVKRRL